MVVHVVFKVWMYLYSIHFYMLFYMRLHVLSEFVFTMLVLHIIYSI
jgi:hypothetical protein